MLTPLAHRGGEWDAGASAAVRDRTGSRMCHLVEDAGLELFSAYRVLLILAATLGKCPR